MARLLLLISGVAGAAVAAQAARRPLAALALRVRAKPAAFVCAGGDNAASCAALGDLYASTNGPAWLINAGWADAAAGVAPGGGRTQPQGVPHLTRWRTPSCV